MTSRIYTTDENGRAGLLESSRLEVKLTHYNMLEKVHTHNQHIQETQ